MAVWTLHNAARYASGPPRGAGGPVRSLQRRPPVRGPGDRRGGSRARAAGFDHRKRPRSAVHPPLRRRTPGPGNLARPRHDIGGPGSNAAIWKACHNTYATRTSITARRTAVVPTYIRTTRVQAMTRNPEACPFKIPVSTPMAEVRSQISPRGHVIRSRNVRGVAPTNSGTGCLESDAVRPGHQRLAPGHQNPFSVRLVQRARYTG